MTNPPAHTIELIRIVLFVLDFLLERFGQVRVKKRRTKTPKLVCFSHPLYKKASVPKLLEMVLLPCILEEDEED